MNISANLLGYIEGYLSVMELRSDIPKDVQEKSKQLSERIKKECYE